MSLYFDVSMYFNIIFVHYYHIEYNDETLLYLQCEIDLDIDKILIDCIQVYIHRFYIWTYFSFAHRIDIIIIVKWQWVIFFVSYVQSQIALPVDQQFVVGENGIKFFRIILIEHLNIIWHWQIIQISDTRS